jgi:hypothetical protein
LIDGIVTDIGPGAIEGNSTAVSRRDGEERLPTTVGGHTRRTPLVR